MNESDSHKIQTSDTIQKVHIQFQRVQTWLFVVPRLRAMVGANALLGEVLRHDLPKLARETGVWKLKPAIGSYPNTDPNDPLQDQDNPAADAHDGILARDGGHFEALFASGGEAFAQAATDQLCNKLPGLRFRISIDGEEWKKGQIHLSTELPVLAPCQWTGRGLASQPMLQGNEHANVSLDVVRRRDAADRAKHYDIASLLSAITILGTLDTPQDLHKLVGTGYLALIHADGNGVGSSAGKAGEEQPQFFHQNRVLLRRALQKAIATTCEGETGVAPLAILMLGGDDLLVVCRAEKALPFVVSLCDELENIQGNTSDKFKLTLGVGVVIAKPTIPIHRLHEVAEQLASSAKRRFRGLKESGALDRSVVDWAVYTTSWVDAPEDVRRRDWICGTAQEQRILSQRPLDVLGDESDSLQGLIRCAMKLEDAPRSQLRYLVEQLPRGRALAQLAFKELSKEARKKLQEAGIDPDSVWQSLADEHTLITPLLDLVELTEIIRLGRSNNATEAMQEAANG